MKSDYQMYVEKLAKGEVIALAVESSNLSAWSYNPSTQVLTILFNKKTIYKYKNVDNKTAFQLLRTHFRGESVGKKFHELIYGRYEYTKINQNDMVLVGE